ncbi:MAG TPA: DUF4440 domain-containing protein [Solibacterales bacterium]|nr:DUF4440 domain-containing protein [Bryobacterales bacterium]
MRWLAVLAACVLPAALHAQEARATSKDEQAVRDLVAAYVDAREQRDARRLAALLAPDADQLVSSGEWRKGRDELVKGMLASSQSNSGARTITVEQVRFVAPGVAIADGRYEIAAPAGAPPRRMWTAFIAARHAGAWRIEAIRNMLPSAAR